MGFCQDEFRININISFEIISQALDAHSKLCDFLVVAVALPRTSIDKYSNCLKKFVVAWPKPKRQPF